MMDVREMLLDALETLLASRTIDDISVKEITECAGVGRSTFYKHFIDKYDLLYRQFDRRCTEVCAQAWEKERSYSKVALAFLEYAAANKNSLRNAFRSSDINSLRVSFNDLAKPFLEQALEEGGADLANPEIQLLVEVYIRGTTSLVGDWILGKVNIPKQSYLVFQTRAMPAELARYVD
jgi:AcrR family transcriptional regulator